VDQQKEQKYYTGIVVSDKMDKTRVVKIEYNILHPLYKKYIKKTKKYKAHDENNESKIGDVVKIVYTRPISKDKFCKMVEIIKRAN